MQMHDNKKKPLNTCVNDWQILAKGPLAFAAKSITCLCSKSPARNTMKTPAPQFIL